MQRTYSLTKTSCRLLATCTCVRTMGRADVTRDFHPFDVSPKTSLTNDLAHLVDEWEKLGIEPDAFVTCGTCHCIFDFAATRDDMLNDNVCTCDNDGRRFRS